MKRQKNGTILFADYPDFRPNLTPYEIFKLGSFGGTYWRPIHSRITGKNYKNKHLKYQWKNIPNHWLTSETYDTNINKYKVKVGTSLKYWEDSGWITKTDPYGWVQWYCNFYAGRRTADDSRQIDRWLNTAGPNSRFRKWLIGQIRAAKTKWNDYDISPKIRQTLQHWAYQLTRADFEKQ